MYAFIHPYEYTYSYPYMYTYVYIYSVSAFVFMRAWMYVSVYRGVGIRDTIRITSHLFFCAIFKSKRARFKHIQYIH